MRFTGSLWCLAVIYGTLRLGCDSTWWDITNSQGPAKNNGAKRNPKPQILFSYDPFPSNQVSEVTAPTLSSELLKLTSHVIARVSSLLVFYFTVKMVSDTFNSMLQSVNNTINYGGNHKHLDISPAFSEYFRSNISSLNEEEAYVAAQGTEDCDYNNNKSSAGLHCDFLYPALYGGRSQAT